MLDSEEIEKYKGEIEKFSKKLVDLIKLFCNQNNFSIDDKIMSDLNLLLNESLKDSIATCSMISTDFLYFLEKSICSSQSEDFLEDDPNGYRKIMKEVVDGNELFSNIYKAAKEYGIPKAREIVSDKFPYIDMLVSRASLDLTNFNGQCIYSSSRNYSMDQVELKSYSEIEKYMSDIEYK